MYFVWANEEIGADVVSIRKAVRGGDGEGEVRVLAFVYVDFGGDGCERIGKLWHSYVHFGESAMTLGRGWMLFAFDPVSAKGTLWACDDAFVACARDREVVDSSPLPKVGSKVPWPPFCDNSSCSTSVALDPKVFHRERYEGRASRLVCPSTMVSPSIDNSEVVLEFV